MELELGRIRAWHRRLAALARPVEESGRMTRRSLAYLSAIALCGLLAACTSTEQVLQPSALTSPAPGATAASARLNGDFSLRFEPVVGATTEAMQPLSARLASRAAETGIELAPQDGRASMTMKGFFSAISDNGATTVIFVWDVVDPDGNRLHRIQGQQAAPRGDGQGWDAVTEGTMQAIADETMNQLVAWLATRQG
jgi:hypothetical protein